MNIIFAYNYFTTNNTRYKLAVEALEVLATQCTVLAIGSENDLEACPRFFRKTRPLLRNATTVLNYSRPLPFVRDVLSRAVEYAEPKSFLVYLNSDIIVDSSIVDVIKRALDEKYETFTASATQIPDVNSIEAVKSAPITLLKEINKGYDAFGFKHEVSSKLEAFLPDFLLGEHKWDLMIKDLMDQTTKSLYLNVDRGLFYHIMHDQPWQNRSLGFHYNDFLYDTDTFRRRFNNCLNRRCEDFGVIKPRTRAYRED